jgi:alpha-methylacyl-CoA racemase
MDPTEWGPLKERLTELFATKTRDEWCELMEHTDVCFAPVLTMSEAAQHPHNLERETFIEVGGATQPAPAPRFSRTENEVVSPPAWPGQHTRDVLQDWGVDSDRVEELINSGAVRHAS